ncbi:MAG: excinuclease ABC subunit UvrA [Muribaculaceae bacterium]|nr:excinuclease ABC subunit UvrA [Muribaculaceae bacterium]
MSKGYIEVVGSRVNNLKNVDVVIPRNSLTVITGLSGSGKSSLAFDTIYAEGQRRYIETFSSYARNFLGALERPDVDKITGLSPVIAIEQKTTNKNPRSTVGTTTEVYDFMRLLFARAGEAYSYLSGEKMVKYGEDQIISLVLEKYADKKITILAPLVRNRKGHYKELFEQVRKKGYLYVRIDGEVREILPGLKLDRYKNHSIELVVDRLRVSSSDERRLRESLRNAMKRGEGLVMILDMDSQEVSHYSRMLMDPKTGLSYSEPAPHNFSFNSPNGACPCCKGLGYVNIIDKDKIIPDTSLSIHQGGIEPLGKYKNSLVFWQIEAICDKYGVSLKTPIKDIPDEALDEILNGTTERLIIKDHVLGSSSSFFTPYEGLVKYIEMQNSTDASSQAQKWAGQYVSVVQCGECNGMRLNKEALHYRIADKNIAELANMDISTLYQWLSDVEIHLTEKQKSISTEIIKEIKTRLKFLIDVGLSYLSLNRTSVSLSGGESQRIRLATQIGTRLVNVLYILDEPSIGLHQRDNVKLIDSLKKLRDIGNTVIVVEHDKDMMLAADYIIDLGPGAGRKGGDVVFAGTPEEMLRSNTITAEYLNETRKIEPPKKYREGNGKSIKLIGATGNNLKNVDLELPLGKFICMTGVSGSGKSSLINSTLQPIISSQLYRSLKKALPYERLEGLENIDKLVTIDQSPLGRTPRSNPATYTNVFSDIRNLFTELPESKIRGYKSGRFSFNISGGRCEACGGNGYKSIEMNFLPDVMVMCDVCHGKRYNSETLEVRYKGKSIADVLDMTINRAVEFFENVPAILNKIKVLQDVGLGYIKLGQPSTTLSGGESQRVKLAFELSKKDTGNTLYLLDEPTTGLHFEDIRVLLNVLNKLADKGNTILVIEHNLDIIKSADYIIDMGPEGGVGGGKILCAGTPKEICKNHSTYTTKYLKDEL